MSLKPTPPGQPDRVVVNVAYLTGLTVEIDAAEAVTLYRQLGQMLGLQ